MRNPRLYKVMLTNLDNRETKRDFVHASSYRQAMLFIGRRYPQPPWLIDSVTDTVTNITFTRDEWREAVRHEAREE